MWGPCALCMGGKNLEFEHHAVCRAGFFGRFSEHGRAKNFLGCTCLRSMLGKCTTAVHIRTYCSLGKIAGRKADVIFSRGIIISFNYVAYQQNIMK